MSEALKQRVIDFVEEIWHKGNLDALDQYIAPGYVRHTRQGGREGGRDVIGIEDARKSIAALRTAFPDIHFTADDILVDWDKVVVRWTCTGTHRGLFRGIPPTGKHITFIDINIYRLRDGKIVERWAVEDSVSLLQQLGAMPA
ncbi:MAG: ester cyclase [Alphaproteobacteria bacterium]|nr:ester cyclase [Alphaproteobacteria bacterium]